MFILHQLHHGKVQTYCKPDSGLIRIHLEQNLLEGD